eukprot:12921884-Prorocentrum_lima.AAC.1
MAPQRAQRTRERRVEPLETAPRPRHLRVQAVRCGGRVHQRTLRLDVAEHHPRLREEVHVAHPVERPREGEITLMLPRAL